MSYLDGDKFTKNEIKVRLNKIGVPYEDNNNSKQYFIELYNKAIALEDNRVKLGYRTNTQEKKIVNQSSTPAASQLKEPTKKCQNNGQQHHDIQFQNQKRGISFSLIIFAIVLAFIVSLIQLHRSNGLSLLEQFPSIKRHIHQINSPIKKYILSLMSFVIKTFHPFIPDTLTKSMMSGVKMIEDDVILLALPLIFFLIIFFWLFVYLIGQKKRTMPQSSGK